MIKIMKKQKLITGLMLISALSLAACGGNAKKDSSVPSSNGSASSSPIADMVKVSFDLNYGQDAPKVVEVEKGTKVAKPEDPTRTGYNFNGWYTDADTTNAYNFDTIVNEDFTLYAGWLDASKTYYTVTFDLNYEGAPEATSLKVESGKYVKLPATPTRDNYEFVDWYLDAATTQAFQIINPVTADMTLYAGWIHSYTFEAEYIDSIADMSGAGYSGTANGYELIKKDRDGSAKASNGYYVTYLYYKGATLEYTISSDKAVDDAKLILRLSAEVKNISLTTTAYNVLVNDTLIAYPQIDITDVPAQGSGKTKEFADFVINKKVSLKQGSNTIKLVTNNNTAMFGTMASTAPMVDCMKIVTDASLTFTNEETANLDYVS